MKSKCLTEIWSEEESSRDTYFQKLQTILGTKLEKKKTKKKFPVWTHRENMRNTLLVLSTNFWIFLFKQLR